MTTTLRPVYAMAFTADGRALWTAHGRDGLAVWDWPSLTLLHRVGGDATALAADVDGFFVVKDGAVVRVGSDVDNDNDVVDQPLRLRLPAPACAVARTPERGLWVVTQAQHTLSVWGVPPELLSSSSSSSSSWSSSSSPSEQPPSLLVPPPPPPQLPTRLASFSTPGFTSVVALPRAGVVIGVETEGEPRWFDIAAAGGAQERRVFDVFGAAHVELRPSSWLSADAGPRGDVVLFGNKRSERGWFRIVDGAPQAVTLFATQPFAQAPMPGLKGPGRGAAYALHPSGGVAVVVDISGRWLVHDAASGAVLAAHAPPVEGGYRSHLR